MKGFGFLSRGWEKLGDALRGVLTIGSSSAAGQLAALLAVPVISRLYAPESMGIFASVLALTTIFVVVAPLRLDSALQVSSDRDTVPLLGASIASSFAAAALCLVVVYHHLVPDYQMSTLIGVLIVVYVVIGAQYNVLSSFALRTRQYRVIAVRNFTRQVSRPIAQIGIAPFVPGWVGLMIGAVFGQMMGIWLLARQARRRVSGNWRELLRWRQVVKYWRFPVLFAPSAALNAAGVQVPMLFIATYFGAADAGNLAQALRLGAAPAVVIGVALSSVIMAEISKRVRDGDSFQRRRFLKASSALLCAGLLWGLMLVAALPPLLPTILGPGWEDAGGYVRAIAVSAAASIMVAPLSVVLVVYQRAFTALFLDASRIGLTVGSGLIARTLGLGAIETCFVISVASAFVYLVTWLFCLRTVSSHPSKS